MTAIRIMSFIGLDAYAAVLEARVPRAAERADPREPSEPAHSGTGRTSVTSFPPSGRRPRSTCRSSTGVPAAHACGRAAVGYAIGNGVSPRGRPANTSGSSWSRNAAASSIARTIRHASSHRP